MPKRARTTPTGVLDVIERELSATFPESEVVDRELEIAEGRIVDLVAVDAHGRLLLVSFVDGDGDAALLLALDALDFVRRNREVLVHHLQHAQIDVSGPPLAVLVAERFSESLLHRLQGLDPDRLRCLEVRYLKSAGRDGTYLVPVLPAGETGEPLASRDPADFLIQVPQAHREVTELLLRRLVRVDERLETTVHDRSVTFRVDGDLLCSLSLQGGELSGLVTERAHRITRVEDVDAFLEDVIARVHELIRAEDGLVEVALDPAAPAGAILTTEEIEAFRAD